MKNRILGNGLEVSEISLGCMGMTHAFGAPSDKKEMTDLLHKAVDLGYKYFDTAECYTGKDANGAEFENEKEIQFDSTGGDKLITTKSEIDEWIKQL